MAKTQKKDSKKSEVTCLKGKLEQKIDSTNEVNLDGAVRVSYGHEFISTLEKLGEKLSHAILYSSMDHEVKAFPCGGAIGGLPEVTAMVTVSHNVDYCGVRCPRFHKNLNYIDGKGNEEKRCYELACYCGENLQDVPIVKEEEFANNNIFKCPYAGGDD